jgi:predicted O-methyltransferase YrrM
MTLSIYEQLEIPEADRITAIPRAQAEFMYEFLTDKNIAQSLEVGFAYGCSTAHIMVATGAAHIAIDPYQHAYKDLGLKNIAALGLQSHLRFEKEPSHDALPKLHKEGVSLDFAFIDGGHRYDQIFIDWFYIDLMLKPGGFVMFDDGWMRSTQLVASFVRRNREDYREVAVPSSLKRQVIVFEKVKATDKRAWYHFREFYNLRSFYLFNRIKLTRLRAQGFRGMHD